MSFASDKVAVAILTAAREVGGDAWQQVAFDVAGGKVVVGGHDYSVPRARAYAVHALHLMTDWPRASIVNMVGGRGHADQFFGNIKVMRSKPYWDDAIVDRVAQAIFAIPEEERPEIESEPEPATSIPVDLAEEIVLPQLPLRPVSSLNTRATAAPLSRQRAPAPRPAVTPGKRSAIELLRQAVENTQRMTPPEESR
jgi:hypothetical protein